MIEIYGNKHGFTIEGRRKNFSFRSPDVDDIEKAFNCIVVERFIEQLFEDQIISAEIRDDENFFQDLLAEYEKRKDPHLVHEVLLEAFEVLSISDYEEKDR